MLTLSTPRTDAKAVRFLQIERKLGEPVRFYDRFRLRNAAGQYIAGFREHYMAPFGQIDPQTSEYFPILGFTDRSTLYCQNARDRPDDRTIKSGIEVKLIATDYGLSAYNVLGNWADSHDCYYFNDYVSGEYSAKQTWTLAKADGSGGTLRFGDKVTLQNAGKQLGYNYSTLYGNYYLSMTEGTSWTIEPITEAAPANAINYGDEVFLKHVQSGKYITPFRSDWSQWKPTLGQGERVKLTCSMPQQMGLQPGASTVLFDGAPIALVSTRESLAYNGTRCDNLFSGSRFYFYYYADHNPTHSTWHLTRSSGAGALTDGAQVRIVNKSTGQAVVPDGDFLTSASSDGPDTIWVLEKCVKK